jgi:hypothetical protein
MPSGLLLREHKNKVYFCPSNREEKKEAKFVSLLLHAHSLLMKSIGYKEINQEDDLIRDIMHIHVRKERD